MFVHVWCEAAVQGLTHVRALETISPGCAPTRHLISVLKGLDKGSYRDRSGLRSLLPSLELLCLFVCFVRFWFGFPPRELC